MSERTTTYFNQRWGTIEDLFADIRNMELLTAEQEVTLAQYIHDGQEAYELLTSPEAASMTPEFKDELWQRIEVGNVAEDELARKNMPFVVSIAKKWVSIGLPLDTLIAFGSVGLLHAVRKFDPVTFKSRFTTYADDWVKSEIRREVGKSLVSIKISTQYTDQLPGFISKVKQLEAKLGYSPSDEEIANHIKKPLKTVKKLMECMQSVQAETTTADLTRDDPTEDPFEYIEDSYSRDQVYEELLGLPDLIKEVLSGLSDRQAFTVIHHYGLDGKGEYGFTEIAVEWSRISNKSCGRQTISDDHKRAIEKLQNHPLAGELSQYFS
jgi:RNA polymerase primary sigma factor